MASSSSSSSAASATDLTNLHTDTYLVTDVNPGGKKFDRVNRLVCKGSDANADVILDIASEVFSLAKGDKFKLCLSGTLRIDGNPDEDVYNQDGKVRAVCLAAPADRAARRRRRARASRTRYYTTHPHGPSPRATHPAAVAAR